MRDSFVIIETSAGFELWSNKTSSPIIATFRQRSDADLFIKYASISDRDRLRNAALNIARDFPDLNYTEKPVNPNGELVLRIERLIAADFPTVQEKCSHA